MFYPRQTKVSQADLNILELILMPWKDSTKPGLLVYDVTCDDGFVEDEEYYYVVCTIMLLY